MARLSPELHLTLEPISFLCSGSDVIWSRQDCRHWILGRHFLTVNRSFVGYRVGRFCSGGAYCPASEQQVRPGFRRRTGSEAALTDFAACARYGAVPTAKANRRWSSGRMKSHPTWLTSSTPSPSGAMARQEPRASGGFPSGRCERRTTGRSKSPMRSSQRLISDFTRFVGSNETFVDLKSGLAEALAESA